MKPRKPLRRPTPEQVRAWQDRQREKALARPVKPRKPIARRGKKAKREEAALALFRAALQARSRGLCEAQGLRRDDGGPVCLLGPHAGAHSHHCFPEDRDRGVHNPARGLLLCAAAHAWTHANPAAAKPLGLLRPDS